MISTYAHYHDTLRKAVIPTIDSLLRSVGKYASYPLEDEEYAVTLDCSLSEARSVLWEVGYRPELIAALKTNRRNETESGSWSLRPNGLRSEVQYHLHLFEDPYDSELTHVYGHKELNWVTNPKDHYRPPPGTYRPEPAEKLLKDQLDEAGYQYFEFDTRRP